MLLCKLARERFYKYLFVFKTRHNDIYWEIRIDNVDKLKDIYHDSLAKNWRFYPRPLSFFPNERADGTLFIITDLIGLTSAGRKT